MRDARAGSFILLATALFGSPLRADDDPRSPTVAVSVVDEAGQPVAGAKVRIIEMGGDETTAVSDAAGSFRIPRPYHPDHYLVSFTAVDAAGNRQGYMEWRFHEPGEWTKALRIVLKASREILVRVVDKERAQVAGAVVSITSERQQPIADGRTGDDGAARIAFPADAAVLGVFAFKTGLGYGSWSALRWGNPNEPPTQAELPVETTITIAPAKALRIRAVDSTGKPLGGLTFSPGVFTGPMPNGFAVFRGTGALRDDWRLGDAVTDGAGFAEFTWLSNQRANEVPLVRSEDFVEANRMQIRRALLNGNRDVAITMLRRTPISGRVVGRGGKSVAGIVVLAQGVDQGLLHERYAARSGADGTYSMKVAPDHVYALTVVDADWAAAIHIGVNVAEDQPVGGLDFELTKGTVIRGVVTGSDQAPVAARNVWIDQVVGEVRGTQEGETQIVPYLRLPGTPEPLPPGRARITLHINRAVVSDADGRYQVRVGPGDYEIAIAGNRQPQPPLKLLDEPEVVRNIEAPALRRPVGTAKLTGVVRGPDGDPVKGAVLSIRATPAIMRKVPTFTSNDEGRFETTRAASAAWLIAVSPDGALAGQMQVEAQQQNVELALGPSATLVAHLMNGEAPVSQRIISTHVRLPAVGPAGQRLLTDVEIATTTTSRDGRLVVPGLAVGASYQLRMEITTNGSAIPIGSPWTVARSGKIDLGYIDLPDVALADASPGMVWLHADLPARAANRFGSKIAIADRIAQAASDARRERRRLMLVLGDPKSSATQMLLKTFDGVDGPEDYAVMIRRSEAAIGRGPPFVDEFKRPIADFERVHIDVTDAKAAAHLAERYRIDVAKIGLPALVILGDEGRPAAIRWFSPAGDPPTLDLPPVRDFLTQHMLPVRNAEDLLAAAFQQARTENKRVFLHQTAIDSYPSRLLGRFVDAHSELLNRDYVYLNLDPFRCEKGTDVIKRYRAAGDTLPWLAILDADGTKLADSDAPDGNIGFPAERESIDWFLDKLLKPTAKRLMSIEFEQLRTALYGK